MLVMGLDPGLSGGIAVLGGPEPFAIKMPSTLLETWDAINRWRGARAYMEKVHSMPGQGVKSMFTFGRHYGSLEAFLAAAEIPYEYVQPGVWQKAMGCLTRGDKNVSKRKAQQLFPSLRPTHATADALLIASYGMKMEAQK